MKILVTGGAGYIGSTICWALKDNGHTPVILDSLVTSHQYEVARNLLRTTSFIKATSPTGRW